MKLYALQGACSLVSHIALNLANTDYELEILTHAQTKSPEFLAINPMGAVPVIDDNGYIVAQNLAVLPYLNHKFPHAKLFGTDAGDFKHVTNVMHWLGFLNSDLHTAFGPLFHADSVLADKSQHDAIKEQAKKNIKAKLALPNDALANQDYLTGEFTLADVYLYVILRWATSMKIDLAPFANLTKLIDNVQQHEAVKKALAEEKLPLI